MSLLFADIEFPEEIYSKDGSFTPAIRNLIDLSARVADAHLPAAKRSETVLKSMQPLNSTPSRITQTPPSASRDSNGQTSAGTPQPSPAARTGSSWSSSLGEFIAPVVKEAAKGYAYGAGRRMEATQLENDFFTPPSVETVWVRQQREEMARRRTSEASKDSKQQKDKKKHAKRNNESSDEEKDAEEAKTSKAEKSNSSDLSRVLIPTVMVVGGAVVSAASTYFASRNAGHAQFLEEFRQVVEDAEAALESAQHWVRERERLYLPVPQLVRDDIRKLKDLCDLCYRLDDSSDRWKLIPGYVILGLGGISVAAAALTGGVVDETTGGFVLNLAAKAGAAGLSVGTAWVVGVLGLRSSSVYTSSYELYASRIISTICSPAWVNTERHARAVRETLAAPELHSQVHAPPAAVPEGARVRQEMRQQDLPDVPSDEPLIDFERPPSPLGVDVGIPRYRTRRQETPKLEPLSI